MSEMYKIRRKVDGLYYAGNVNTWDREGRIRFDYNEVLADLRHLSGNFQYKDEDTEIITIKFVIDKVAETAVWAKHYREIQILEQVRMRKRGGFLYAVMVSSLDKVVSSIYLNNEDGWFNIDEIVQKTGLNLSYLKEVISFYSYKCARADNSGKYNLKRVFRANQDFSKVRLASDHKIDTNSLENYEGIKGFNIGEVI